jgi:hypothetical protein
MLAAAIASGHLFGADLCFLIAVILFAIAALASVVNHARADAAAVPAALIGAAAVALGLLLL